MITKTQKKFIEDLTQGKYSPKETMTSVYLARIQTRLERELEQLLWLCIKHPEVFLDEDSKINDMTGKIVSHRRLKKLILCLKALNKNCDVELVLKEAEKDGMQNR